MRGKTLAKANYLSLLTFRKSGAEVATPVWFAEQGGAYYIFSAGEAGKVKRLRNSDACRVAPCTVSGKVTGDWVECRGELIADDSDVRQALAALRGKYGWQMSLTNFLSGLSGKMDERAYIRVTPV